MENMIKQMRVRFSGAEEGNEGDTSRDRDQRLPSQKTRSFRGDNRRSRNWYRGQSSRELSYDYDSDYMESDEFQTAVAAAAFAVTSVEERRRMRRLREDSVTIPKRKPEDGAVSVTRRARERLFSSSPSNKMKNKEDDTVPVSTSSSLSKKSSELRERAPSKATSPADTEPEDEAPKETVGSSPFVKKTSRSTSSDRQSDKRKPESGLAATHQQPTTPPALPATEVDRKRSEPRLEDIKADVWEKTEMERIKERYEKLNAKILEWEYEKKAKAKKKLSRNKDEPVKKRARALQKYKTQIEMIDQIVEGARSQAEENQRKEIIKVKEKANIIRLTGKIPTKTCLCF